MRAVTQTHFIEEQIMVQRETSLKEGKKKSFTLSLARNDGHFD